MKILPFFLFSLMEHLLKKINFNFIFIFISFFLFSAHAESGRYSHLDWPIANELVRYHSCGCADSCWVAELLDKKSRKVKLSLKCDCEKLSVSYEDFQKKEILQNDCKEFQCLEVNCKSDAITKRIKQLKELKKI